MEAEKLWEKAAKRFGMWSKLNGHDGYDLRTATMEKTLRGLDDSEVREIFLKLGLDPKKFLEEDALWEKIEARLKENE